MYRFLVRPRWLAFHVLCIALVVSMVNLGFWQYDRLQQRRDFNAETESRQSLPPEPFTQVVQLDTDPAAVEWRIVTVSGSYLAGEQVLRINASQAGAPGVNVVTPLAPLDDGRLVLVNRGFVPVGVDVPRAPSGVVQITGRLRVSEARRLGGLTDPPGELAEIQRIDIDRLAQQLPRQLAPLYIDLIEVQPPQGDVPLPLPPPRSSEGSHLSYMVQWWIFSVLVVIGWTLAVRRSIQQRRRVLNAEAARGSDGGTDADYPPRAAHEGAREMPRTPSP